MLIPATDIFVDSSIRPGWAAPAGLARVCSPTHMQADCKGDERAGGRPQTRHHTSFIRKGELRVLHGGPNTGFRPSCSRGGEADPVDRRQGRRRQTK